MTDIFGPRVPGPERCSWCSAYALLYCRTCRLSLCGCHKVCPDCESDELVVPLHLEPRAKFAGS
jgi:hypothetical protein